MCKEYGGLGIPNLRDWNVSLLGSWVRRYSTGEGKLWKDIIDFKYNTYALNIFAARDVGASQFFRGFMYAARAAKMGFRWRIVDGKKVRFWENNWLGSSSLAIQFWELYVLVNEKTKTVFDLWDDEYLKCTCRRTFDEELNQVWLEVVQLAGTIRFSDEEDAMISQFCSFRIYSSQSLYKVINFRGIRQLKIAPRVHFFLWLLIHDRVLTRANLAKRREVENTTCLFCLEEETCHHLFFGCVVARKLWKYRSVVLGLNLGEDINSVGRLWLSEKKYL
ncbi:hypothetical protein U9M48_031773, partial [Paspalum notatum var. saurae]